MTDHQKHEAPFAKHRDGALECAIWRRETDSGVVYNTELSRSYKNDQGGWQKTHSISDRDLLRAARLQEQAYSTIQQNREQDRAAYIAQQRQSAQPELSPEQSRNR